jgi:hypothetical protein
MGYEYYLNVVEHGDIDDSDSEDENGDKDKGNLDDFDSDGNPVPKTKK